MYQGRKWTSLAVCAAVAGTPAAASAWAAGTHAYVAKHTNKMNPLVTGPELCRRVLGANGPDLFNAVFDEAGTGQALAAVLHTPSNPAPNLSVWYAAEGSLQRAFGFGFASHNETWGTDWTAHVDGMIFHGEGYVTAKAALVGDALAPSLEPYFPFLTPEQVRAFAREVSHNFVELAVDFLLADVDPGLGGTLAASAGCYAGDADDLLLWDALGPYLAPVLDPENPAAGLYAAKGWIDAVEPAFVDGLGFNGYALSLRNAEGRDLIVQATVAQAKQLLAYKHLPAPDDLVLYQLIDGGISVAQLYCAGDFLDEIEATIGRVNGAMSSRGFVP